MTRQRTILYIEDDEASRVLIHHVLTYAGYRVLIASTALEGLDLAQKYRPDLILTDINLPDLSGREITVRLRADPALAAVPIVAVTAQTHAFERDKTFAAGVSGYMTKPVDVSTLTERIEKFLNGHRDTVDAEILEAGQAAYTRELVERLEANVRELENSNRHLRRLDRIKDDFIQLTAHELRTPLTTVYGYNSLALSSPAIQALMAENEEVRLLLQGLSDAIDRMYAVVSEIVTISRIASGRVDLKLAPTRLADIIGKVVDEYRPVLDQRQLQLVIHEAEWAMTLYADRTLLELALSNVLGNAIKYTPDGGTITLHAEKTGDTVLLRFHDTGIGINPDDQARIFDRFYTAGDTQLHSTSKTAFRGGGLGLGLAIARGIVEAHAGSIWVESEGCDPQRMPGSTFFIELPIRATSPG